MFSWADWTRALSAAVAEIEAGGGAIDGRTHSEAWLTALEALSVARGAVDPETLRSRTAAWREAYLHTPHGEPVTLDGAAA